MTEYYDVKPGDICVVCNYEFDERMNEKIIILKDRAQDLENLYQAFVPWLSEVLYFSRDELITLKHDQSDYENCSTCNCAPGDGLTDGCEDPDGCGYYRRLEAENT